MTHGQDNVRRVLVVEDEVMVAMYVEELLCDLGYDTVVVATGLDQALSLARQDAFDFAVLDINLNGRQSFPVADVLRARGIPFIFATGYGRSGVEEAYRDTITLMKPFERSDVQRAFARTLASRV